MARDRRGGRRSPTAPPPRAGCARPRRSAPPTLLSTPDQARLRRRRPALEDLPALIAHADRRSASPPRTRPRRSPPPARSAALLPAGRSTRAAVGDGAARASTSACTTPPTSPPARCSGTAHRERGAMKVGIVGMPNAGKSSLFNALTRAGAEAANYPFTTIEPNVAVVPVADERLDQVAETIGASSVVPRHDRLPRHRRPRRGRARGRGAGQPVPGQHPRDRRDRARRARAPRRRRHPPRGRRRPAARHRDDRDRADLRRPRAGRAPPRARRARRRAAATSAAIAEERWLRERRRGAAGGPPGAHGARARRRARRAAQPHPLTAKPVLFVANVDEGDDEVPPEVAAHAAAQGAGAVAVSSRLEAELSELDDDDAAAMRADLGIAESGLRPRRRRRLRAARPDRLLHRRRGQAGAVLAPAPRPDARGTPPARSTPTSSAASCAPRSSAGTRSSRPAATRARATAASLRLEGRDYVMRDGDVITVKFTP